MTYNAEYNTGKLFGSLWKDLTDEQFSASVELFTKRALENKFDLSWIEGKKCLDAGCGSGRYSVALSMYKAKRIDAIDVSKEGIELAKKRCEKFKNIFFKRCSILDLPFKDQVYDFVWSAGVVHHTKDMDKSLKELSRVLKTRGKIFLLLYGSGGLRWKIIKTLRPIANDLGKHIIRNSIVKSGLPENNKKHFMDDLFVPIQHLSNFKDVKEKLIFLGFENITRWEGNTYDHEQNISAQLQDIKKLEVIFENCLNISEDSFQKYLSELAIDNIKLILNHADIVMNDKNLSEKEMNEIIIGEKNLRVVADKI